MILRKNVMHISTTYLQGNRQDLQNRNQAYIQFFGTQILVLVIYFNSRKFQTGKERIDYIVKEYYL